MLRHEPTRGSRLAGTALVTFLLAAGGLPGTADGQQTDGRWLPFFGCWQPVSEEATRASDDALLCLQPVTGEVGVEMISIEDGEIVARETLRADGLQHDSEREGCTGWSRGEFSARPGVVYIDSEHACEGDVLRGSTGVVAMVSPREWIDVKVVTAGGESMTWVARYRLATQRQAEEAGFGEIATDRRMAVLSARVAAAAPPSVDDVIEASEHVAPEAVGAWVAERDVPLDLSADELVRMADAGLSEEVIDMVIAVSYPERFAVDRGDERYERRYDRAYRLGGYWSPWGWGRWGYYDPFYSSLFYSPYGYGRYGYGFGYGYGYRGYVPVIITGDRERGTGRVIRGRGYTRGQGRSSGASGARPASPRGTVSTPSRGSSGGRSGGRTAKRRPGGF